MKIKGIGKAILLLALLMSAGGAVGRDVNVEFKRGYSNAQYTGVIKGYDYDTYNFYARKDQKLKVALSDERLSVVLSGRGISTPVDLSEYSPELDGNGQYTLPATGKYQLRILQTRNEARKNKIKKYDVNIQIKPVL